MNVYLCGFRGSGKSTIGKVLAKKLELKFLDLDTYVEEKCQMPITDVFLKYGEEYFRKVESQCLFEIECTSAVIATGGGALVSKKNALIAKQYGYIIFIDTSFSTCYERVQRNSKRPLANSNSKNQLLTLFKDRLPYYISHSHFQVDGNDSIETITEKIITYLKQ